MNVIMACDCDLRSIHCWCSVCGMVCTDRCTVDDIALHHIWHDDVHHDTTVLFEIASPVSAKRGGESSAIMYNLSKWMIFNAATAMELAKCLADRSGDELLVAPSNKWTKGYEPKVRHTVAKADAKNKDLRECQSMIFFYTHEPDRWVPLSKYLENL